MLGGDLGDLISRVSGGLNAETYGAVLRLVITEALMGTGRAGRVVRIQVSPPGPNGRRVLVEWEGAAARGQVAVPGAVDGYVAT